MELNKQNPSRVHEPLSSNSKDYELNSDTLDHLYKEQLIELKDVILKRAQPIDIEICSKWLKVFSQISKSQKMARNCLCNLMQEQIRENSCLQEPFINLQNCKRNLDSVLRDLDDQTSAELSTGSFFHGGGETYKSHGFTTENTLYQQQHMNMAHEEKSNIEFHTETAKLIRELQALSLELTAKQNENIKLKEIVEKSNIEMEAFEDKLENIKTSILQNINEALLVMRQPGMIKTQMKIFQCVFKHFSYDKEFMDNVSKYDLDLNYLLHKQLKCEFDKRKSILARHICQKFAKSRKKLREKFERRLVMQNATHKLELKFVKLNSFSVIRQIFINYHNEFGKLEGWEILKTLEEKYQNIVNTELK